jgi:hypothetical protein
MNNSLSQKPNSKTNRNPLAGVMGGALLFLCAFPVLYFNEAQENLSKVAEQAVEYNEALESSYLGYTVGAFSATNKANDPLLTREFVAVTRTVEMYGYIETQSTSTANSGNTQSTSNSEIRYTYSKAWLVNPSQTTTWRGRVIDFPRDLPINYNTWILNLPQRQTSTSTGLSMNNIPVDATNLDLSAFNDLSVTQDMIADNIYTVVLNDMYFSNQGTINSSIPVIGDVRISFTVIEFDDQGLLLGNINNNQFSAFTTDSGNILYRFFNGESTIENVVSKLQTEYQLTIWIFRGVGFFMLFVGLLLSFKPISTLFNFIPIFGSVGSGLFTIMLFVVSLVLAVTTIVLSLIVQNILVISLITLGIFGLFFVLVRRPKPLKTSTSE